MNLTLVQKADVEHYRYYLKCLEISVKRQKFLKTW